MTSSASSPAQAALVANSFVLKYYTMLNEKPQSLFHFYKEHSSMTHFVEEPAVPEETAVGKQAIHKKIQSRNYNNCQVVISALDAQSSEGGGILISVIGSISNNGEPSRRFVQTFFLGVQTDPNGYYIRNDIFRYLEDSAAVQNQQVEKKVEPSAPVQPVQPVQPVIPEPQKVAPTPVVQPEVEKPKPIEKESVPEEKVTPKHKPTVEQPVVAETKVEKKEEKPQETAEKKKPAQPSNAQTVPAATGNQDTKPQESKPQRVPKEKKQPQQQQQQQQQVAAPVAVEEKKPEKLSPPTWATVTAQKNGQGSHAPPPQVILQMQTQQAEEEKKALLKDKKIDSSSQLSIYVNNLPFTISEERVRAAFSDYGEIKSINLKANKGYAFIEYNSPEHVQAALVKTTATPVVLDGRKIIVDIGRRNNGEAKKKRFNDKERQENGKPKPDTREPKKERKERPQNDQKQSDSKSTEFQKPRPKTEANHQPKPQKN